MNYPKILVTDSERPKALAIIRGLAGMNVYTAADRKHTIASWSKFSKGHFICGVDDPNRFVGRLVEICNKNDIRIIITPEERSSMLVAQDESIFVQEGIIITTPPFSALRTAMDKALTINAARQIHIKTPETKEPKSIEEARAQAECLGYPIVVKPRFSYYWDGHKFILEKGTSYANNIYQLEKAINNRPVGSPIPLLQKYVKGYGTGVFLALNKNHDVTAQFAHERIRDLNPTGSGSVLRKSIPVDPILLENSVRLLKHIGWYGVAMVEYMIDSETKENYLMEINGRFWGSLQLSIDSGVNFPKILVDMSLNKSVKVNTYKCDVFVRWWIGDLIRLLLVFKGKPAGFAGNFPSRWKALREFFGPQPRGTHSEVFRWNDPLPAFFEVGEFLYRYSLKIIKYYLKLF